MVRVVLAAVAILLGSRGGVAQESCDGEASSLLQTAGRNAATTAVSNAQSHSRRKSADLNTTTAFSTSDDACLGCYKFQDLPSYRAWAATHKNASCWWSTCDEDGGYKCYNATEGYTFAAWNRHEGEEPDPGWEECPSESDLPEQFFSTVSDACRACNRVIEAKASHSHVPEGTLCWSALCTQELCNATQGYTFEAYDELPATGWEKC